MTETVTIASILFYIFYYLDVELGLLTCAFLPVPLPPPCAAKPHLPSLSPSPHPLCPLQRRFAGNLVGYRSRKTVQLRAAQHRRFNEGTDEYLDARLVRTLYHSATSPSWNVRCRLDSNGAVVRRRQVLREEIAWGVLVAMLQYVPASSCPSATLAEEYATVQMAMASSERIFELMDAEPEPVGGPVHRERIAGAIEFRHVWFAYEDEEWVLRDVSFCVEPGQSLALVGATGSGKTTIISLLCRFYEIQRGQILVDGIDIREWNVEALRTALWSSAAGRLSLRR